VRTHTDQEYINAIANKDNDVLSDIYQRFLPKVIGFVIKNRGQEDDARDIFNKVVFQLSARLNLNDFKLSSSFEGYLFTACKNLWRRELNRRQHRRVTSGDVKELYYEQKDLAQGLLEQERWELFKEMLKEVSDNCKQILQLFFDKTSGKDIMATLGYSSEVVVRQRVFKCKAQLAKLIQQDGRFAELKNV